MDLIEFPLTGNLRPKDVVRTVYPEQDKCAVRNAESAEGRNLFELALADYKPGCVQEVWHIGGSGAFIHRDWRDEVSLPNAIVKELEDEEGKVFRKLFLVRQDGSRLEEVTDGRVSEIFDKLLESSHYVPVSDKDYLRWIERRKRWKAQSSQSSSE